MQSARLFLLSIEYYLVYITCICIFIYLFIYLFIYFVWGKGGEKRGIYMYKCLMFARTYMYVYVVHVRDRAEGGARGALAPPLLCKKKIK